MQTSSKPIAHTLQGDAQGMREGAVNAWLGLPYAQPPVGTQRFLAPQPAPSWSGVRDATAYAAACPQKVFRNMKSLGPSLSEDCLTLNVWSPAADDKKRPVMVWLHGGAFLVGSARAYGGAHLAAQGDIVVVTVNYRLGVLGFVNFGEALGDERMECNLGLRDQIAALQWVRDNISAFGGDPQRVTIAGESAGSMSISLLMHAPQARPLFHGAIMQSGALSLIHDRAMSLKIAHKYLEVLGVSTLAELQALPIDSLLKAQSIVRQSVPDTVPAAPWFDGDMLPASLTAARLMTHAPVPLLAGFNREEIRFFETVRGLADAFLSRPIMRELLQKQLSPDATSQVLSAYPDTKEGTRALGTHMSFGMPTLHFAERHARQQPTWFYRFDLGGFIGAAHAVELFYLWKMRGVLPFFFRGGPLWGAKRALAMRLRAHWISFVRNGKPGHDWDAFEENHHATMLFDRRDQLVSDPDCAQRLAWAGHEVGPGFLSPHG